MREIPLTKRNRMERMVIACTLLTSIWEEVMECEAGDIEGGLLQNAVYAQVDINRIVGKLNELNGCEPQTERTCTNCKHNGVLSVPKCDECHDMDKHEFIEPQTDCQW